MQHVIRHFNKKLPNMFHSAITIDLRNSSKLLPFSENLPVVRKTGSKLNGTLLQPLPKHSSKVSSMKQS